ncbi:MAG: hypothetical protein WCG16_10700 [Methylococcales bacterium]
MKTESTTFNTEPTTNPESPEAIDNQRRHISKLALWTPPVMLTLMLSKRSSAESLPSTPSGGGF